MLSTQFNPLNYFGIDGDIFCTYKTETAQIFNPLGPEVTYPSEISFYNVNPDKIYTRINIFNNFNALSEQYPLKYINFYNFNQPTLELATSGDILFGLFYNCGNLEKLNFDGTISITDEYGNGNAYDVFSHCYKLDLSNIKITIKDSEINCNNIFLNTNIFNKEKTFKEYNVSFVDTKKLVYSFARWGTGPNYPISMTFEQILGFDRNTDNKTVNTVTVDEIFTGQSLNYSDLGTTFFGPNLSMPKLNSALNAFNTLYFNLEDLQNLANSLPTYTSGSSYRHISVGVSKDITDITNIENTFTNKGWTVSLTKEV